MFVPFRSRLDRLFRNGGSTWLKMGGCIFVLAIFVAECMWKTSREHLCDPILIAFVGLGTVVVGSTLSFGLSLKDGVERSLSEGESVHPLLKLYLGSRGLSIALWFVTVIACVFLATILSVAFIR